MSTKIERTLGLSFSFAVVAFYSAFVYFFFFVEPPEVTELKEAKPIKVSGVITSKDENQKLSVKSAELPKVGDVINVNRQEYGSVATGDVVCIQYKSISSYPQEMVEFVSRGKCQK